VEVRECEVAIDPNRDWRNTRGRMCSHRRELCFCPAFEEEIHGPYPIRVREFDGFGPLGEWARQSLASQKSEASTRLHYATAWPANDELVLVLIIVIESQENGQKFATLKRYIENRW